MKIIILYPHIIYPSGATKYMLETGDRLAKNGLDVLVLTTVVNKKLVRPYKHLKFHALGGSTTGSFFFWISYPIFQWRLHRFLDKIDNKILFPHILPPVWWAGIYKLFNPKTPVVWMCQEPSAFVHSPLVIESLKQPMKTLVKLANPFLNIFDKWLVGKNIDYMIANSTYGKSLIKKTYQRKADLIAYPSVDIKRFKPQGKKDNYFFTVSRLDKQKNIDILLHAFKLLPLKFRKTYKIIIGGNGTERKKLEVLAKKLNISDRVTFLGWVGEPDLPLWYSQARLAIFCAKDEPFGIIPVEAMATGTAVIATKSGGVGESVLEGETGYLIKPKDPRMLATRITTLLNNKSKLSKMAKVSRVHTEKNFSWDKTADIIERFFKDNFKDLKSGRKRKK